jgi:hypothetical protein
VQQCHEELNRFIKIESAVSHQTEAHEALSTAFNKVWAAVRKCVYVNKRILLCSAVMQLAGYLMSEQGLEEFHVKHGDLLWGRPVALDIDSDEGDEISLNSLVARCQDAVTNLSNAAEALSPDHVTARSQEEEDSAIFQCTEEFAVCCCVLEQLQAYIWKFGPYQAMAKVSVLLVAIYETYQTSRLNSETFLRMHKLMMAPRLVYFIFL